MWLTKHLTREVKDDAHCSDIHLDKYYAAKIHVQTYTHAQPNLQEFSIEVLRYLQVQIQKYKPIIKGVS